MTDPLYKSKGVIFLHNNGKEISQLKDLKDKKIAGIQEDYAMVVLNQKVPDLKILKYSSIEECANALKLGEVSR